jgi:hypothetical protein
MSPPLRPLLFLVAVVMLVCAAPAHAQHGCCLMNNGPAFLEGFAFRIPDIRDADNWAERFGFGTAALPPGFGETMRTLLLPQGSLEWFTGPRDPSEPLDSSIGMPMPRRFMVCIGQPLPPPEPTEHRVAAPPNGALRPLYAIAVSDHYPRLDDSFVFERGLGEGTQVLAVRFAVPDLGADVFEARLDECRYRFIVPTDSTGVAARWLAGGPRWLGIAFEVRDAAAAERALAARRVPTTRSEEHGEVAVRVMPEVTGGALLEFVQRRTYP